MKKKEKVIVGLSGGKDSTAAALLLREKGYVVEALTMKLGLDDEDRLLEETRKLTETIGIPHYIADMEETFQEKVIDYFVRSYAASLTPNPCAVCNLEIKFDLLMNEALNVRQADWYATGHYAMKKKIGGLYFLTEPIDRSKSQIYFMSLINPQSLNNVLFPIGELTVDEVREKVKGLPLANKNESQDVCFLGNRKLMDYLKENLPKAYFRPGDIMDIYGNKIGRHRGAVYFTIGQRRGTGFSSDRKLYVVKKDVQANTITLGDDDHLYSDSVTVTQPVFWRELKEGEKLLGKFRYMSRFYHVFIRKVTSGVIVADFPEPVLSLTPGQVAAFYDGDIIAAAGFIGG